MIFKFIDEQSYEVIEILEKYVNATEIEYSIV